MPHGEGPLWLDSANLRPLVACFQSFLTKFNVGWSPWTAVDALVGLRLTGLARPDLGVRRGRGRPPHIHRYKNFRNRTASLQLGRLGRGFPHPLAARVAGVVPPDPAP